VKGKRVVCDMMHGVTEAFRVGAVGILGIGRTKDVSSVLPMPAVSLRHEQYHVVLSYLNSTR